MKDKLKLVLKHIFRSGEVTVDDRIRLSRDGRIDEKALSEDCLGFATGIALALALALLMVALGALVSCLVWR
jgi:hypothetical protein